MRGNKNKDGITDSEGLKWIMESFMKAILLRDIFMDKENCFIQMYDYFIKHREDISKVSGKREK